VHPVSATAECMRWDRWLACGLHGVVLVREECGSWSLVGLLTGSFVVPHHQVVVRRCICCMLPPVVLVTVAVFRCPIFLKMQVRLVCLFVMSNPHDQQ
jgi:hypothetical protein